MRIVCDNCGAKYQISDEKVQNKVFKIRCKKCSHVIVVRGGAQEGAPPASDQPPTEDPPPGAEQAGLGGTPDPDATAIAPPDAVWYVVINREQVGPLTPSQIQERLEHGEIDADTFTWAEGMADWVALASLDEFGALFPKKEAAPPKSESAAASVFTGSDDDDVMVSNNRPADGGGQEASSSGGDADPRVDAHSFRNQRNENSVLFSLDSLAGDLDGDEPAVRSTGGPEGSGLIDISAMGDAAGGGDSSFEPFGGASPADYAPESPAPTMGVAMAPVITRQESNTGKVIIITAAVVFLLAASGGGVYFFVIRDSGEVAGPAVARAATANPPAAAPAPAPAAKPALAPAAAAAVPAAAEVKAATPAPAETEKAATPKKRKRKRSRSSKGTRNTRRAAEAAIPDAPAPARSARVTQPPPSKRKAKPRRSKAKGDEVDDMLAALDGKTPPSGGRSKIATPASPAAEPALPHSLSRQQILSVVKNARKISSCKQHDPNAKGTVTVNMVIGRNGQVTRAAIVSGNMKGTPVGKCVERAVRSYRFPAFRGDPMTINMPFRI